METELPSNLGDGGEAKASPADEETTVDVPTVRGETRMRDDEREGTMDAQLGANWDPALTTDLDRVHVGAGETAAYGETVEAEAQLNREDT